MWLALLELPLLLSSTIPSLGAPIVWISGVLAIGLLAWRIGSGLPMPGAEEREDANLIAARPGAVVRRWIVAHVDSKAQGHSMAGRLVAAWMLLFAVLVLTALAFYRWLTNGVPSQTWVVSAMLLAVIAGALAARGRLRGGSAGARDNGTGLLAALIAAEQTAGDATGFIFTGAEEFGLVGSRMLVRNGVSLRGVEVINLDTLDQQGGVSLVVHDQAGRGLAESLARGSADLGLPLKVRSLPLGILVDSLPLARAGARAVTVARLDWGTLRLIHTPRDRAEGLDASFAERVGHWIGSLPAPPAIG